MLLILALAIRLAECCSLPQPGICSLHLPPSHFPVYLCVCWGSGSCKKGFSRSWLWCSVFHACHTHGISGKGWLGRCCGQEENVSVSWKVIAVPSPELAGTKQTTGQTGEQLFLCELSAVRSLFYTSPPPVWPQPVDKQPPVHTQGQLCCVCHRSEDRTGCHSCSHILNQTNRITFSWNSAPSPLPIYI